MHRTAFEGVVEIFAMPCAAVDHCRGFGCVRRFVADGRCRPAAIDTGNQRLDVLGVARRHAKADHVDQQFLDARTHGRRNGVDIQRERLIDNFFGNGNSGKCSAHGATSND
jgi:hypothetical protein